MGTDFDFFGKEAAHDFKGLSDTIVINRVLLKTIMMQNNFKSFDSEWWHYNFKPALNENISNTKWKCD
jgi:D-alanyl-D-alanine dipeptidase